MAMMQRLLSIFLFLGLFQGVQAQLVINELSNGPSGSKEFVELLVVGTPGCGQCVDLRGWILDDNNGLFKTGSGTGIAQGHMRFANDPQWQCVGIGALIVIYNESDRNAAIPADDLTDANGNCVYILPASSNLFENAASNPVVGGSLGYNGPYTAGGDWNTQGMSNSNDSYQVRDPSSIASPYHAVSYGNNSSNNIIYFSGSGGGNNYYMSNAVSDDPSVQANWTQGAAGVDETPGLPNNGANGTWISYLNNNCNPTGITITVSNDTSICEGSTVTLTATGPIATYTWSTTDVGPSINVTPLADTRYYVTVDDGNCIAIDSIDVTVVSAPTGLISGDTTVCPGGSTTLTASGGTAYLWDDGSMNAARAVTPAVPTTYTVIVSNATGCADTVSTTVTIDTLPVANITGVLNICPGGSTSLVANPAGYNYLWSTTEVTRTINVSPPSDSTYFVTITDPISGCTDNDTVDVTISIGLVPEITGDSTLCEGDSTTLTVNQGTGFLWSNGETTQSITVGPTTTTDYWVTIAGGCSGTNTDTIQVSVFIQPDVTVTPYVGICEGASTTLTANNLNPAATDIFTWSTGENGLSITVDPIADSTYVVTVTNSSGCNDTARALVEILAGPTVTISGNANVCVGGSTTLTASSTGGSPVWSDGSTAPSITVSPATLSDTLIWAEASDVNGCIGRDTFILNVSALPVVSIAGASQICSGDTTTLTASAGASYLWSTGETTQSIDFTSQLDTTVSVIVSNAAGCIDSTSLPITIDLIPIGMGYADTTVCSGATLTLEPTFVSLIHDYQWSTGGVNQPSITVTVTTDSSFSLTVTSQAGCTNIDTVNIFVTPNTISDATTITAETCLGNDGQIDFTTVEATAWYYLSTNGARIDSNLGGGSFAGLVAGDYNILIEDVNGCVKSVDVTVPGTAGNTIETELTDPTCNGDTDGAIVVLNSNGATYSLNGAAFTSDTSFTGLAGGNYELVALYGGGCTDTVELTIVEPDAIAAFISPDTATINQGEGIDLVAVASGGTTPYSYAWTPAQYLDCLDCEGVYATPDSNAVFGLIVTDANGCIDTASTSVTVIPYFVIDVPTGFTPNGDGHNDFFRPLASEAIEFDMSIYNRWGELVYEGSELPGWDGTYRSQLQPISTFVYYIRYKRIATGEYGALRGNVTLIR